MPSALTVAYQGEMKRTRNAVAARAAAEWARLPDYRDDRIPDFLGATLPVVQAGQRRAVALTSAYLARRMQMAPVGLDTESLIGANVRNGVAPEEVYRRPFVTVWASIATLGLEAAVAKGLSRLTSTVDMDVAMSGRDSLLAFGRQSSDQIIGWTRVADPGCCDYCLAIDGAHTGPDEPQPLHNRCGCTADPVTRTSEGGRGGFLSHLTGALLAVGAVIGDAVIHMHGELGPVIGAKGDAFAGPDDLGESDYIES